MFIGSMESRRFWNGFRNCHFDYRTEIYSEPGMEDTDMGKKKAKNTVKSTVKISKKEFRQMTDAIGFLFDLLQEAALENEDLSDRVEYLEGSMEENEDDIEFLLECLIGLSAQVGDFQRELKSEKEKYDSFRHTKAGRKEHSRDSFGFTGRSAASNRTHEAALAAYEEIVRKIIKDAKKEGADARGAAADVQAKGTCAKAQRTNASTERTDVKAQGTNAQAEGPDAKAQRTNAQAEKTAAKELRRAAEENFTTAGC